MVMQVKGGVKCAISINMQEQPFRQRYHLLFEMDIRQSRAACILRTVLRQFKLQRTFPTTSRFNERVPWATNCYKHISWKVEESVGTAMRN